jgi:hypothetical protein
VSRRRSWPKLQGTGQPLEKRAGAEERSGDADSDGLSTCGGSPLRMVGAVRKRGAWTRDGRGGEARGAMGAGRFRT